MALILKDRVKVTSVTAGTGTITLGSAATGFQSFSVIGNGNTTYYAIVDETTGDWEVGIGTYTTAGPSLSRDTILESSTGGTAVNFAANSKSVFVTYPAEKAVSLDQTLPVASGGTGLASYTIGDIIYASGATTLSKLADVATGNSLISGGVGVAPSWGKVGLTTHVSGTLPVASGGTGATTLTGLVLGNGTSAMTTVTAPTGTVVGTSDTQTLTNKRVTPRVNSTTSTTSPWAWNSDSYDEQCFTALANDLTINADAGTPNDGQRTVFRFKDNGTGRALSWTTGASKAFRAVGVTLPTTTVANKTTYVGCLYNAADSRWDAVATVTEA